MADRNCETCASKISRPSCGIIADCGPLNGYPSWRPGKEPIVTKYECRLHLEGQCGANECPDRLKPFYQTIVKDREKIMVYEQEVCRWPSRQSPAPAVPTNLEAAMDGFNKCRNGGPDAAENFKIFMSVALRAVGLDPAAPVGEHKPVRPAFRGTFTANTYMRSEVDAWLDEHTRGV